jgi:tetratricopeptide (TPR) repeat protein
MPGRSHDSAPDIHNVVHSGFFFSAVIQGRDITIELPHEVIPAMSGLPMGNPSFTGRKDVLQSLLDQLRPAGADDAPAPGTVTAIAGLAGIGKTELAVQAAHFALNEGWFPGGVLFADLLGYDDHRRRSPGEVLDGWLRALGVPGEHVPAEVLDRTRLFASILAVYAKAGQRILLVIDNVSEQEQVQPLLPGDGDTMAIVTSRHTLAMLGARLLDLHALDRDESILMLKRTLDLARPGDARVSAAPGVAADIAALCDGLPLALRIIAALLAEDPARPLSEMANDIRTARSPLDEMSYGDVAVRAAFDLSYMRLAEAQARLFRLMAFNLGPDFSTDAATAAAGQERPVVRRALESLARAHLVEHGTAYGRWRMHDLVRRYALEHGLDRTEDDDGNAATGRLIDYYVTTTRAASSQLLERQDRPKPAAFRDEAAALAWLDAEMANLVAIIRADGSTKVTVALALGMVPYLARRRLFDTWISVTVQAYRSAKASNREEEQGRALYQLGLALYEVHRLEESINACLKSAEVFRKLDDSAGEASALLNLSLALHDLERFHEAIVASARSVTLFRECGDRYFMGRALNNLGMSLREEGRLEEALAAHRLDLEICREARDRPGEALAIVNLGKIFKELGEFERSREFFDAAVEIYRTNGDEYGEGKALIGLAGVLNALSLWAEAINAAERAVSLLDTANDDYHVCQALWGLGNTLRTTGRIDQAIEAHERSLEIAHRRGDHRTEAGSLYNLGADFREGGRSEQAVDCCSRALQIFESLGDLSMVGQTLNLLGAALFEAGQLDPAIDAFQRAEATFEEIGDTELRRMASTNLDTVRGARTSHP